jgi:Flp pilus assembly protein CpaB
MRANTKIIVAVLGVKLIVFVAWYLSAGAALERHTVVFAAKELRAGVTIQATDVAETRIRRKVPANAIASKADAIGKVSLGLASGHS